MRGSNTITGKNICPFSEEQAWRNGRLLIIGGEFERGFRKPVSYRVICVVGNCGFNDQSAMRLFCSKRDISFVNDNYMRD